MNSFIKYLCSFAAMCLGLGASAGTMPAQTADSAQAQAKLTEVRVRIAALTQRLGAELKDRDTLAARVREADLRIAANRQRLDALRSAQLAAERRRGDLRAEETRNQGLLDGQRATLSAQVRAAYLIGREEQIKLLLNQDDPAAVGRMLFYYGYFARERGAKIAEIRAQVMRVQELLAQIEQNTTTLQALQLDTGRETVQLHHARAERAATLAAATQQIGSGTQELAQLKQQEQAEEALIADLARVLQDFPVENQQNFAALRGRLPWPVAGKMTLQSQNSRGAGVQSGLHWSGVSIDTGRGAKVRAPYFGRVVYADWLQGLGLLLIIGHSGNYMTLYGHAEVLYKSVGDWVAPGDVIAALSDSSVSAPQLYFEIRDGRTPEDPTVWLKPAP